MLKEPLSRLRPCRGSHISIGIGALHDASYCVPNMRALSRGQRSKQIASFCPLGNWKLKRGSLACPRSHSWWYSLVWNPGLSDPCTHTITTVDTGSLLNHSSLSSSCFDYLPEKFILPQVSLTRREAERQRQQENVLKRVL